MNQKQIVMLVVAVLVIAAAGVAVFQLTRENNTDVTVTFVVEDDQGVYFWVDGKAPKDGTVMQAWENAVEKYKMPFVKSTGTSGEGIKSLFGLATAKVDDKNYVYWSQKTWTNNAWEKSNLMMSNQKAADNKYFGIIYGNGATVPHAVPSNAVVLSANPTGYVFVIESSSGLYFKAGGNGNNALEAINDICTHYKIQADANKWLKTMFNLGFEESSGKYWSFSSYVKDSWVLSDVGLDGVKKTDSVLGLYYAPGLIPTVTP